MITIISNRGNSTTIFAINRARKVAITDKGRELPFVTLIDCEGNECDDAQEAVTAVFEHPDCSYGIIDLAQFTPVALH